MAPRPSHKLYPFDTSQDCQVNVHCCHDVLNSNGLITVIIFVYTLFIFCFWSILIFLHHFYSLFFYDEMLHGGSSPPFRKGLQVTFNFQQIARQIQRHHFPSEISEICLQLSAAPAPPLSLSHSLNILHFQAHHPTPVVSASEVYWFFYIIFTNSSSTTKCYMVVHPHLLGKGCK